VKKEGREVNEGLIGVGESKDAIALVEINSETDFVTQNEKFKQFLRDIANEASVLKPESLETFLTKKCTKDPSLTVDGTAHSWFKVWVKTFKSDVCLLCVKNLMFHSVLFPHGRQK